jgi:hypothetical protein
MSKALFNEPEIYDLVNVMAFINNFALELDIKDVEFNQSAINRIILGMRQDFPHCDGEQMASPFKKAANFLCYFISERPILSPLPAESVGEDICSTPNHQNVLIGFLFVCKMLHNATLTKSNGDAVKIDNPVEYSRHSLGDIVQALSKATPGTHFQLVAVLLEQMVYKSNSHCQYPIK